MRRLKREKSALRYRIDRIIRDSVMKVMTRLTPDLRRKSIELQPERVHKILVVRALFRMGDTILATPAVRLLRNNFPAARIDFVGPPISRRLFENLPIDRHYSIYRSFPRAAWSYVALLIRLRAEHYDLALDASGSSAALGAVVVGFSGAALRVGLRGRWDRWFNVRLSRPRAINKYYTLQELIGALGLETKPVFPELLLTPAEVEQARAQARQLWRNESGVKIGVFVGGRKAREKRWRKENFIDLAHRLHRAGARPMVFLGPEERDCLGYFQHELAGAMPVVFEPDVRRFAALVADCDLFVACDGGPVHLACALRVRTLALFIASDAHRWGPPPELGRVVVDPELDVTTAFAACLEELDERLSDKARQFRHDGVSAGRQARARELG